MRHQLHGISQRTGNSTHCTTMVRWTPLQIAERRAALASYQRIEPEFDATLREMDICALQLVRHQVHSCSCFAFRGLSD